MGYFKNSLDIAFNCSVFIANINFILRIYTNLQFSEYRLEGVLGSIPFNTNEL